MCVCFFVVSYMYSQHFCQYFWAFSWVEPDTCVDDFGAPGVLGGRANYFYGAGEHG